MHDIFGIVAERSPRVSGTKAPQVGIDSYLAPLRRITALIMQAKQFFLQQGRGGQAMEELPRPEARGRLPARPADGDGRRTPYSSGHGKDEVRTTTSFVRRSPDDV